MAGHRFSKKILVNYYQLAGVRLWKSFWTPVGSFLRSYHEYYGRCNMSSKIFWGRDWLKWENTKRPCYFSASFFHSFIHFFFLVGGFANYVLRHWFALHDDFDMEGNTELLIPQFRYFNFILFLKIKNEFWLVNKHWNLFLAVRFILRFQVLCSMLQHSKFDVFT